MKIPFQSINTTGGVVTSRWYEERGRTHVPGSRKGRQNCKKYLSLGLVGGGGQAGRLAGAPIARGKRVSSHAGTRTRVFRVRAEYPNHLDYMGGWHQCRFNAYINQKSILRNFPLCLLCIFRASARNVMLIYTERDVMLFLYCSEKPFRLSL